MLLCFLKHLAICLFVGWSIGWFICLTVCVCFLFVSSCSSCSSCCSSTSSCFLIPPISCFPFGQKLLRLFSSKVYCLCSRYTSDSACVCCCIVPRWSSTLPPPLLSVPERELSLLFIWFFDFFSLPPLFSSHPPVCVSDAFGQIFETVLPVVWWTQADPERCGKHGFLSTRSLKHKQRNP